MFDIEKYFPNATAENLIKLQFLISDMMHDIEAYGGNSRQMNLNEVKEKIGYKDNNNKNDKTLTVQLKELDWNRFNK